MPQEDEVAGVNWWPASKMPEEAVEEALDNFYFLLEVTNAYATELTWALALALGLTCLYIWRSLGQQEAARRHAHLAHSRPVFSSNAMPTTASSPASAFLSAYKTRFAQKNNPQAEERVNAVGYDVLHTYNQQSPYRQRLVPKTVWQRHGSGVEGDTPMLSPLAPGEDKLWGGDSCPMGYWSSAVRAQGYVPPSQPIPSIRHIPVVPQRPSRTETLGSKPGSKPHSAYADSPRKTPLTEQQLQMRKVHQELKEQSALFRHAPRDEGGSMGDRQRFGMASAPEYNPLARRRSSPSPPIKPPKPAPREDRKLNPNAKPRLPATERRMAKQDADYQPKLIGGDCRVSEERGRRRAVSSSVSVGTEKDQTASAHPPPANHKSLLNHHAPSERKVSYDKSSSKQLLQQKKSSSREKETLYATEIPEYKVRNMPVRSSRPTGSENLCEDIEKEIVERLRHEMLNQDTRLSKYKSASSFLEKIAKSTKSEHTRRHRKADHREEVEEVRHSQTKQASQVAGKASDNRVSRKRSKTVQKTDSRSEFAQEATCKTHKDKDEAKTNIDSYDSAVLRAIKAEEEDQEATMNRFGRRSKNSNNENEDHKKAAGDGECERYATHEAGRRLAKLRKRLEDSLEQIQRQPGLDKELVEKAKSAKLRKFREDVALLTTMKDYAFESNLSVPCKIESKADSDAPPKSTVYGHLEKKKTKNQIQFTWPPVSVKDNEKKDLYGEPNNFMEEKIERNVNQRISTYCSGKLLNREKDYTEIVRSDLLDSSDLKDVCTTSVRTTKVHEVLSKSTNSKSITKQPPSEFDKDVLPAVHDCSVSARKPSNLPPTETEHRHGVNSTLKVSKETEQAKRNTDWDRLTQNKYVSRSGKIMDEDSLDDILARQSKRREILKQRKRHQRVEISENLTTRVLDEFSTGKSETSKQQKEPTESKEICSIFPVKTLTIDQNSHLQTDQTEEDKDGSEEKKMSKRLPVSADGPIGFSSANQHISAVELTQKSSERKEPENDVEDESNTAEDNDNSPIKRNANNETAEKSDNTAKSDEEQRPKTPDPGDQSTKTTENRWSSLLGLDSSERESPARRRVRWRRQAERAERLRGESVEQLTPPPVPPKMTRFNDIAFRKDTAEEDSADLEQEKLSNSGQEAVITQRENKTEAPSADTKNVTFSNKLVVDEKTNSVPNPSPPRLVRGPFICTIKEKNSDLAAGETGLVTKGSPDKVEICVEKSLSPSKAASVFDPKVQLEKDKEKQEAERAARSIMSSPQFKANVNLFERAAENGTTTAKPASPESKVKANVRMFEEATKSEDPLSFSPEHCGLLGPRQASPPSALKF